MMAHPAYRITYIFLLSKKNKSCILLFNVFFFIELIEVPKKLKSTIFKIVLTYILLLLLLFSLCNLFIILLLLSPYFKCL